MEALAIAFIQSVVTGAGTAAGGRLIGAVVSRFEKAGKAEVLQRLQSNPTPRDEQAAQKQLVAEMKRDPGFVPVVSRTLKTELRRDPELMARVGRLNRAIGDFWGLSDEQILYKSTSRCPIGGERIWWFPRFVDLNGNEVKMNALLQMPRSTIAVCRKGHSWPMYDNGV